MPFSHNRLKTTTGIQVFSQVNKYTLSYRILHGNVHGYVFAKNRPVSLNWTDYTHLAALRCTDSSLFMSRSVWRDHTVEAYSSCGRTRVLCSIGATIEFLTSLPVQDGGPHDVRSKMAAPTTPRWRPPRHQDGGPTKSDTRWRPL